MPKRKVDNAEEVVKEAVWLAWQACGSPAEMGVLQNNPTATKEDVWNNIHAGTHGGDYSQGSSTIMLGGGTKPGNVSADYVFGRMMKLRLEYGEGFVLYPNGEPEPDYQAWAGVYPTYEKLVDAAVASLKGEVPF